ncbi:MAG: hypothetical protein SNJ63_00920 [Sphingomonadaceae bacterium]
MRSEALLLLALLVPAPVTAAEKLDEADRIAALPASGPARRCLALPDILETQPVDGSMLLVREGAARWYRNRLPDHCGILRPTRLIAWRAAQGVVCEGDVFDVVEPASRMRYGNCLLGPFEPVPYGETEKK